MKNQAYMNKIEQVAQYPQLPHVTTAELKRRAKKIDEPSQEVLLEQFKNHTDRFD